MNIFLLFVFPAVVLHLLSLLLDMLFPPAKPGVRNQANAQTGESDTTTTTKLGCVSETVLVDQYAESQRNKIAPQPILCETRGSTDISGDHAGNRNRNGVNDEKAEIYLDDDESFKKDMVNERLVEEEEEEDWEGISSSNLERLFWAAVVYVDNGDEMHGLTSDLKLRLYGLHQVATEGPCNVPQPMALKFSARAKWNAWQRLGSMSAEAAMEKYINLLTSTIPGWTQVRVQ